MEKRMKTCSRGHEFQKSSDCPVCPICWSGYYKDNAPAVFASLSAPALRALLTEKITTPTKLSKYTEKQILEFHGMGPKSLPTLRAILKKEGLAFRPNE